MIKLANSLRRSATAAFVATSLLSSFGIAGAQAASFPGFSDKQNAYAQHTKECIEWFWSDHAMYEANCTPAIDPGGSINSMQGTCPPPKHKKYRRVEFDLIQLAFSEGGEGGHHHHKRTGCHHHHHHHHGDES